MAQSDTMNQGNDEISEENKPANSVPLPTPETKTSPRTVPNPSESLELTRESKTEKTKLENKLPREKGKFNAHPKRKKEKWTVDKEFSKFKCRKPIVIHTQWEDENSQYDKITNLPSKRKISEVEGLDTLTIKQTTGDVFSEGNKKKLKKHKGNKGTMYGELIKPKEDNNVTGKKSNLVSVNYSRKNRTKVWICPTCGIEEKEEGALWINCDTCGSWHHFQCVGISSEPPKDEGWNCSKCTNYLFISNWESIIGRSDQKEEITNTPAKQVLKSTETLILNGSTIKLSNDMADACQTYCKICNKSTKLSYLRSHAKIYHNIKISEYKKIFGYELEIIEEVFHKCGICQDIILLDYHSVAKHLKSVEHRNRDPNKTTHKDYNKHFIVTSKK